MHGRDSCLQCFVNIAENRNVNEWKTDDFFLLKNGTHPHFIEKYLISYINHIVKKRKNIGKKMFKKVEKEYKK